MEKVIINSYEEFEKLVGQQIGVSDYVELSQERINLFADATLDHQWIHVDTERAKVDSPYHSTIEYVQIDNICSLQFFVYLPVKDLDKFIHSRTVIIVIITRKNTEKICFQ